MGPLVRLAPASPTPLVWFGEGLRPSSKPVAAPDCDHASGGPKCRSLVIAALTNAGSRGQIVMQRWLSALVHLLFESFQARRDARIRILLAQVEMLRRKLDRNRVILSPEDRAYLLRIGSELGHDVNDVLGIVTHQTCRRCVRERQGGREPRRVGRPRVSTVRRRLILWFARENIGWGYSAHIWVSDPLLVALRFSLTALADLLGRSSKRSEE